MGKSNGVEVLVDFVMYESWITQYALPVEILPIWQ